VNKEEEHWRSKSKELQMSQEELILKEKELSLIKKELVETNVKEKNKLEELMN